MTLVKLDNGDYINTDYIVHIYDASTDGTMITCYLGSGGDVSLTVADRKRIVADMQMERTIRSLKMMALQRGLII